MIREKDGIHVDGEKKYVLDSRNASGDVNFVSHAHFDHLHQGNSGVISSELTAKLVKGRTGKEVERNKRKDVELLPSGHILGSRAARFENGKYLYTGDFSMRDRAYLDGFKPVDAEVLIMETTYGIPAYRFPEQNELESRIVDWIQDSNTPAFLYAYSLGKAQKIQSIVQENLPNPIYVHEKVSEMNSVIENNTDLEFRGKELEGNELEKDAVFVGPTSLARNDEFEKRVERNNGVKAGFSGWAVSDSYRFRGGYDETFPYSDHADFDGLVKLVGKVDPEKVYTHHGFDEAFASHLKKELGINARSLKKNQSSLHDFSP